nr:hypothetical protein [Tanacetum cinerariifolium]
MRALLPSTSRWTDILEADMPPRKRACLTAPTLRFKIGESSVAGAARQRMDEFETRFEDTQFDRALRARVNTLFRDRPDHHHVLPAGETEELKADESTHAPRSPITIPFSHIRLRRKRKNVRPEPPMLASMETDILEADMPPRKRACLTAPTLRFKIGESSDEIVKKMIEIAPTTLEGVNKRVIELDTTVRQRMDEFETRFEDAQFDRALRARVNTLFRDRPDHRRTAMLMDREAMYSHLVDYALRRIKVSKARDPEPQEGPVEAGSSC